MVVFEGKLKKVNLDGHLAILFRLTENMLDNAWQTDLTEKHLEEIQ